MELTAELKIFLSESAASLSGSARRLFMARAVRDLGRGGQRRAERELGWSRGTVRKGRHELDSGITCVDGNCRYPFPTNSSVTLTATPGAGSVVSGWSGADCASTATTCTVTMGQARTVGATFTAQ